LSGSVSRSRRRCDHENIVASLLPTFLPCENRRFTQTGFTQDTCREIDLFVIVIGIGLGCAKGGAESAGREYYERLCMRAVNQARKRHFLSHLYIKINILPRQARDKHRENS
jgi:hypothetical protein